MRNIALLLVSAAFSAVAGATGLPAPEPAPAPEMPAATTGTVARAQFASGIQDREPVDGLTNLPNDKTQVYFFTELKDMTGTRVTHRWEYKGQVMAEQPFDVGGARWRVWSSKTFDPLWTGEWKVSVVDGNGATLAVHTLGYESTSPAPQAPPAPQQ
jgi:hypothetical protein